MNYKVTVSVSIDIDLLKKIDEEKVKTGMGRSVIMHLALEKFFSERGRGNKEETQSTEIKKERNKQKTVVGLVKKKELIEEAEEESDEEEGGGWI